MRFREKLEFLNILSSLEWLRICIIIHDISRCTERVNRQPGNNNSSVSFNVNDLVAGR